MIKRQYYKTDYLMRLQRYIFILPFLLCSSLSHIFHYVKNLTVRLDLILLIEQFNVPLAVKSSFYIDLSLEKL